MHKLPFFKKGDDTKTRLDKFEVFMAVMNDKTRMRKRRKTLNIKAKKCNTQP